MEHKETSLVLSGAAGDQKEETPASLYFKKRTDDHHTDCEKYFLAETKKVKAELYLQYKFIHEDERPKRCLPEYDNCVFENYKSIIQRHSGVMTTLEKSVFSATSESLLAMDFLQSDCPGTTFQAAVISGTDLDDVIDIVHHARTFLRLAEERLKRHKADVEAHRAKLLDFLVKWHDAQLKKAHHARRASDSSITSITSDCDKQGPEVHQHGEKKKVSFACYEEKAVLDAPEEVKGVISPPYDGQATLGSYYEERETTPVVQMETLPLEIFERIASMNRVPEPEKVPVSTTETEEARETNVTEEADLFPTQTSKPEHQYSQGPARTWPPSAPRHPQGYNPYYSARGVNFYNKSETRPDGYNPKYPAKGINFYEKSDAVSDGYNPNYPAKGINFYEKSEAIPDGQPLLKKAIRKLRKLRKQGLLPGNTNPNWTNHSGPPFTKKMPFKKSKLYAPKGPQQAGNGPAPIKFKNLSYRKPQSSLP